MPSLDRLQSVVFNTVRHFNFSARDNHSDRAVACIYKSALLKNQNHVTIDLMHKSITPEEIYNDTVAEMVNVFSDFFLSLLRIEGFTKKDLREASITFDFETGRTNKPENPAYNLVGKLIEKDGRTFKAEINEVAKEDTKTGIAD